MRRRAPLRRAVLRAAMAGLALAAAPLPAQVPGGRLDPGVVRSPVLVLDFERLYAASAFGRRVAQDIETRGEALAAENRRIEAELTAEERDLTDRRAALPPDDFRALATAFDEKVQRLRDEQDAKTRALGQAGETARRQFFAAAQPVLQGLMAEAGAAVILERRAVLVAADAVDVTDAAVARVDDAIGDGAALPEADPAPGQGAAPAAPSDP